jgi:hypothetical protein
MRLILTDRCVINIINGPACLLKMFRTIIRIKINWGLSDLIDLQLFQINPAYSDFL